MSRKEPFTFVTSIRLSACISAVPAGRITVKFDIGDFYENPSVTPYVDKIWKNVGHFTWRPKYVRGIKAFLYSSQ